MRKAMRGRAARIFSTGSRDRSPVIVKQVSIARPVGALKRIARYIGRLDVDYDELKAEKRRKNNIEIDEGEVFVEDLGSPQDDKGDDRQRPPQALLDAAAADNDTPPLVYDQHGNEVPRSEMLARLEEWGLTPDVENLTIEGREILDRRGRRALDGLDEASEARAFGMVQGRHIVLSIPETKPLDQQRLEEVVRETVKRTFGNWGYPALVAVHLEHGREIHAHVLVGTANVRDMASRGAETREVRDRFVDRLGFDYDGMMADALRLELADVARLYGFDVDGSRREDRRSVVEKILSGQEDLRPRPRKRSFDDDWASVDGLDDLPAMVRRIVRRAPGFVAVEGPGAIERLAASEINRAAGRPAFPAPVRSKDPAARNAPAPSGIFETLRRLGAKRRSPDEPISELGEIARNVVEALRARRVFEDAKGADAAIEAVARWQTMRREDVRLADWVLANAPHIFGPATAEGGALAKDEEFKRMLDGITDVDVENQERSGQFGGFRGLQQRAPATARELVRRAVEVAQTSLQDNPAALGEWSRARRGQQDLSRAYVRLASAIDAAFPDDVEMLKQAVALRDLAAMVLEVRPIPTSGGHIAEIDDLRVKETKRQIAERPNSVESGKSSGSDRGIDG